MHSSAITLDGANGKLRFTTAKSDSELISVECSRIYLTTTETLARRN